MEAENHYSALFAQAMNTPAMMAHHHFATPPPPTIDPSSTTIKMEDFAAHLAYTSSPFPPTSHPATPDLSSTSSQADGKPGKKRKSWGQVLPEPKTNLPPRKRAKTEDEKEQRRIERVKRNRLAAHNSRERKRQEVEHLQDEKDKLEADLQAARAAMARMAAQLKAFQQRHPNEVIDETFDTSSTANETNFEALLGPSETVNPRQTSFPSPVSMASMDSPRDESCAPDTPAYTESVITDLDQTRYPAAILCDLHDAGLSYSFQPHMPSFDDKPLDDLFSFDSFPETQLEQSATSLVDSSDFFTGSLFDAHTSNPYGLSDAFDTKHHFDLQTASGAALTACDEALAATEV
ncbi:hypothetical protein BU24DRAFT_386643 [Aaosphaeria arxii CBS 175.79]|uniref:BZIP domain-containing protein n=1 Tax=Aaosphaeria arxii CBS 175.79 TaxID=1450172 RepID=A0A6A5Y321_9PLEO|nr:uncharacterized protein BU24DRAFT_386643 [Aaosphaeria arxii CBS 175.79]KAF2019633.1 hypothetical protein BU24DRAFT_386643 [Aaosphaeria arxii CBS 175.79]